MKNQVAGTAAPAAPKTATLVMNVPVAKKHSVRFNVAEGTKDAMIDSVYVTRLGAMKAFGIADLDAVKGFKLTLEPIL